MILRTIIFLLLSVSQFAHSQKYSEVIPIVRIQPSYPLEQLRNKQEGWVKIQFEVTVKGTVENPKIIESYPEKVFDRAAIAAILKFKFKPRIVDGKPVRATVAQTMEFSLPKNQTYNSGVDLSKYEKGQLKYALQRGKSGFGSQNTLAVLDAQKGILVHKIKLPGTSGNKSYLAQHPDNPHMFFYHQKSNTEGRVLVINKSDLEILHTMKVGPIVITNPKGTQKFRLFSANEKYLLAYLKDRGKPTLHQIDGSSGEVIEKIKFPKYTFIQRTGDVSYLWARNYKGKKSKRMLKIIDAYTMEIVEDLKIVGDVEHALYWRDNLEILIRNKDEVPQYKVRTFNFKDKTYFDDFTSTTRPKVHSIEDELFYIGNESDHLKIAKLSGGAINDITNSNIRLSFNDGDFYFYDEVLHFIAFGDQTVAKINMQDTLDFKIVEIPMDATAGIVNKSKDRAYVSTMGNSDIALVDFNTEQFIAAGISGGLEKKDTVSTKGLSSYAFSTPNGFKQTPLNGFDRSNNTMLLNHSATRVFAINSNTNDVTSFNADDMSDQHIVQTGLGTFKIVQGTQEEDLPLVVIGMRRVTFLSPSDGRMIKQIKYDEPIEITVLGELSYSKDFKVKTISLIHIPLDD